MNKSLYPATLHEYKERVQFLLDLLSIQEKALQELHNCDGFEVGTCVVCRTNKQVKQMTEHHLAMDVDPLRKIGL